MRVVFRFLAAAMVPAALLLIAAAPDPVREQLIAQARGQSPTSLLFDRTTTITRVSPIERKTTTLVERWDGRQWSLVSVDGRSPTASQTREAIKAAVRVPVPGYYRLAALLAAANEHRADTDGHVILQIPQLPAGTVTTGNDDISAHLSGEVTIASHDGAPWVQSLRISAREKFKLNLLITVSHFEQSFEYRLDSNGQPRLATQVADSLGQMFGQTGGEKSEARYAYR